LFKLKAEKTQTLCWAMFNLIRKISVSNISCNRINLIVKPQDGLKQYHLKKKIIYWWANKNPKKTSVHFYLEKINFYLCAQLNFKFYSNADWLYDQLLVLGKQPNNKRQKKLFCLKRFQKSTFFENDIICPSFQISSVDKKTKRSFLLLICSGNENKSFGTKNSF